MLPRVVGITGEDDDLDARNLGPELCDRRSEDRLVAEVETPIRAGNTDCRRHGTPLGRPNVQGRAKGTGFSSIGFQSSSATPPYWPISINRLIESGEIGRAHV